MVVFEDECVGCEPWMGCLHESCPHMNVPHFYCDKCGGEWDAEDLYDVDGEMICEECLLEMFPKINTDVEEYR